MNHKIQNMDGTTNSENYKKEAFSQCNMLQEIIDWITMIC